jgi:hypothetical protein
MHLHVSSTQIYYKNEYKPRQHKVRTYGVTMGWMWIQHEAFLIYGLLRSYRVLSTLISAHVTSPLCLHCATCWNKLAKSTVYHKLSSLCLTFYILLFSSLIISFLCIIFLFPFFFSNFCPHYFSFLVVFPSFLPLPFLSFSSFIISLSTKAQLSS